MTNLIRVAVTGPESTGKSVLTRQLADFFSTEWVPEYAREYLNGLGRPYQEDDLLEIARGQLDLENLKAESANGLLFCDTEAIVVKIWSMVKYGRCHPWIRDAVRDHRYDLFLLCDIDIPWEYDPQREHPGLREHLFGLYRKELDERGFRYEIVTGLGTKRLNNAVGMIRKYFDL